MTFATVRHVLNLAGAESLDILQKISGVTFEDAWKDRAIIGYWRPKPGSTVATASFISQPDKIEPIYT